MLHDRLYGLLAPFYDLGVRILSLPFGGERRLRGAVFEALGCVDGWKVLEPFCGTAAITLEADGRGALAVGLDLSCGMLAVAAEKARKRGGKARFVRGDAASMPFASGSFHAVVVSMGLHEVDGAAREAVLREAHRVLVPGGRLVVFDYDRAEGAGRTIQRLFFLLVEGETVHTWLDTDAQGLLAACGFEDFRKKRLAGGALQVITVRRA
ncbi:MAG TPA: methyltransferase domain-containing protein [Deltaproteobacteria bacterium]|nr:methyltransferase domain-containing protein [Deltaproteobacteria bacterium]